MDEGSNQHTKKLPLGKFAPPKGHTLLMVGQDNQTIYQYLEAFPQQQPAGFMFYSSIQHMDGLDSPSIDHGAGVSFAQEILTQYPNSVIQIGLYMVDGLPELLKGHYDQSIDHLIKFSQSCNLPIYLRIGYEFDLPQNGYEPDVYQNAYRYIVDYIRCHHVNNIAFVWHSYGIHNTDKPIELWYPGFDYVDWVSISFFYAGKIPSYQNIYDYAQALNKPFMIGEATPFGFDTQSAPNAWSLWYQPFFDFIERNDISAISYINCNWESFAMWQDQGWGDARLQNQAQLKQAWLAKIKQERYLLGTPDLFFNLGYDV